MLQPVNLQQKNFETTRQLHLAKALYDNDVALLVRLIVGSARMDFRIQARDALLRLQREQQKNQSQSLSSNFQDILSNVTIAIQAGDIWALQPTHTSGVNSTGNLIAPFVIPAISSEYKRNRLFKILLSEFYSPWPVKKLFQALFPNEIEKNENAIRNLLHQSIFELRKEIATKQMPIQIIWRDDFVWLYFDQPVVFSQEYIQDKLKIHQEVGSASISNFRQDQLYKKLSAVFTHKEFSIQDVQQEIQIPRRTAQRHLRALTQSGQLIRTGSKVNSKYHIPNLE